jgi:hypothetical protein
MEKTKEVTEKASGSLLDVLKNLASVSNSGGYGYLNSADAELLGGYAKLAPQLRDPQGRVAARVSKAGHEFLATAVEVIPEANPVPVVSTPVQTPVFVIESGFDAPTHSIRTVGSKYPFATMAPPRLNPATGKMEYDTFFIAATEEHPKPHKAIIGSVSAANKKNLDIQFASRKVEGGARVWRMK